MSNESNYDYGEEIEYIVQRATAEGSVPGYLKEAHENKLDIRELVSDIIIHQERFIEKTDEELLAYSNDDEYEYIAEKTGYTIEVIELVLWFYECWLMKMGNVKLLEECRVCGNDELLIREDEDIGDIYATIVQCGKCGEKYTYEQLDEYNNIEGV